MAVIKMGKATKNCSQLINYAEKRAEVKSGHNCDIDYAKSDMKQTRMLANKDGGRQAFHVIQSFRPDENITPQKANEIGLEFAQRIAPDYQAAIYTHTDTEHTHNHIVINSVNIENQRKFDVKHKDIFRFREVSNEICKENDLSIPTKKADYRYTQAEPAIMARGETSWKQEIRVAVDNEKEKAISYDDFKENMMKNHNIEVTDRGKNVNYLDKEGHNVNGYTLGDIYERDSIKKDISMNHNLENKGNASKILEDVNKTNEKMEKVLERVRGMEKNLDIGGR